MVSGIKRKVLPVIALRMVLRDANILIHVEGDHILEGDLARLVGLDQLLIHPQRCSACWKSQDKHPPWPRVEGIDPLDDIFGGPLSHISRLVPDDQLHDVGQCSGMKEGVETEEKVLGHATHNPIK